MIYYNGKMSILRRITIDIEPDNNGRFDVTFATGELGTETFTHCTRQQIEALTKGRILNAVRPRNSRMHGIAQ